MIKNEKSILNSDHEIDEDVIGFYALLFEVDKRINPHLYENNGSANNAD